MFTHDRDYLVPDVVCFIPRGYDIDPDKQISVPVDRYISDVMFWDCDPLAYEGILISAISLKSREKLSSYTKFVDLSDFYYVSAISKANLLIRYYRNKRKMGRDFVEL
jgi:hypothetical protein